MGQQCCSSSDLPQRESQLPETVTEVQWHSIMVRVTSGSLIDENTDAIMIIADHQMSVHSYLGKQTIKLAGKPVYQELLQQFRKRKIIEFGDVMYAHGGELDFDFIFAAIMPSCYEIDADCVYRQKMKSFGSHFQSSEESLECLRKEITNSLDQKQYIQTAMKKTLKLCVELGLKSISFPIICSESHAKCYSALVMLVALKQFLDENQNHLQTLNLVNFTVADKEFVKPLKVGLSKLICNNHLEIYETPQLVPEHDVQPYVESYENDMIIFGHTFKNRREDKQSNRLFDSI